MNKRQIKQKLSELLETRINEEVLSKKGNNKKIKGKKQRLSVNSSAKYAKKLAPLILNEFTRAVQEMVISDFTPDSKALQTLERKLLTDGVKFEGPAIQSTVLDAADFTKATLSWTGSSSMTFQLQFPVDGKSMVINPEFGDVDERKGPVVHTVMFQYSPARETLFVTGLDTVFKGA